MNMAPNVLTTNVGTSKVAHDGLAMVDYPTYNPIMIIGGIQFS